MNDCQKNAIRELTGWYEAILSDIKTTKEINFSLQIGSATGLTITTDGHIYYLSAKKNNP